MKVDQLQAVSLLSWEMLRKGVDTTKNVAGKAKDKID
jgi:hypothetical protein